MRVVVLLNMALISAIVIAIAASKAKAIDLKEISDISRVAVPIYALGLAVQEASYENNYTAIKQLAYTAVGAQLATEALKKLTREKRPDYEPGDRRDSFPSGHAVGAFSGAFFIHRRYGLSHAALPYAFAALTAYQRVDARRHHVHDVLAGIALAGAFAYFFTDEKTNAALTTDGHSVKFQYATKF